MIRVCSRRWIGRRLSRVRTRVAWRMSLAVWLWLGVQAPAGAQGPARRAPEWARPIAESHETVTDLGHGLYALASDAWPLAGNVTVAVGGDGLIVVDTQFAALYPKVRARITSLSTLPVRFVISTHYHGDHVGGNEAFANAGALVVAHARTAEHMAYPPRRADGSPGLHIAPIGLPTIVFDGDGMTLRVLSQTARLVHPAIAAHTDGDTFVYFPEANVISAGDLFDSLLYPGMELQLGASIDGLIAAARQMDSLADDATRIVPGHGRISSKADLDQFLAMLTTARERVAKAKADGMTEDEVAHANLLSDLDDRWLLDPQRANRFPELIYRSLR
jgi:cyclase